MNGPTKIGTANVKQISIIRNKKGSKLINNMMIFAPLG